MSQFMNQDSVEFTWTEQPVDTDREHDTRTKNASNCGAQMPVADTHWNALCHKIRRKAILALRVQHLRFTTLFAYARNESGKHTEASSHPYDSQDDGRPALCH